MEVSFSKNDIRAINKEDLFSKRLFWDVIGQDENGEQKDVDVFPSIGDNKITFYHKGIILFRYICGIGFETHFQNTTVTHPNKNFVTEQDISKEYKINNYSFVSDYENIKRNASRVATDEKKEISKLYARFSCARRIRYHGIQKVLLDQEISIDNNRIDFALFDFSARGGKALRFYEVKMFDDPRIVKTKKGPPEVFKQATKYKEAIRRKKREIFREYKKYVGVVNELFSPHISLVPPELIEPDPSEPEVCVIICGFGPFGHPKPKAQIDELEKTHKIKVYSKKGSLGEVEINDLWDF